MIKSFRDKETEKIFNGSITGLLKKQERFIKYKTSNLREGMGVSFFCYAL
jgi:hypothetical protein